MRFTSSKVSTDSRRQKLLSAAIAARRDMSTKQQPNTGETSMNGAASGPDLPNRKIGSWWNFASDK
jgi:hypothetical protein